MDRTLQSYFTTQGRLKRLGFLYSIIFIVLISFIFGYVFVKYTQITGDVSVQLIVIKSIISLFILAIWTPFIIRRFHDIGLSGWFSIVFWITAPFEDRNVAIAQIIARHPLETLTNISQIVQIVMLIVIFLLLVMPSAYWPNQYNNPNKSFKMDATRKTRIAH